MKRPDRRPIQSRFKTARTLRSSWPVLAAVFILGIVPTIAATKIVSERVGNESRLRLQVKVEDYATALRIGTARAVGAALATSGFFAASKQVEPTEFDVFAMRLLQDNEALRALAWVPHIRPEGRAANLTDALDRGLANYAIRAPNGDALPPDKNAFPTWFIFSAEASLRISLGTDWGSIPQARVAMEQARDSGRSIATAPLEPFASAGHMPPGAIVAPVYKKGTPRETLEERRSALEGYVVLLERPEDFLKYVAERTRTVGIQFLLIDVTDRTRPHLLGTYGSSLGATPQREPLVMEKLTSLDNYHVEDILVAGRQWRLIGVPTSAFEHDFLSVVQTVLPVMGSLVSILLVGFVWLILGRIGRGELDRLQAIANCTTDGIITANHAGRITSANPAAVEMFGASASDLEGERLVVLMPERFRDKHKRAFARFLDTGERSFQGPIDLISQRADGSEFPVELTVGTWRDEAGQWAFAAVIRDGTHRREIEAELLTAKEVAEDATRAKSEFLAKMSHELRTPLNAIVGLADLLRDTKLSRSQRADLLEIDRSADALLRLVSDILDLSRIEARELELTSSPFALRALLADAMLPLTTRAHSKGLELACRVAPDVPEGMVGDPGRLQQVLLNLIGNAVKFTEAGEVVLEVERSWEKEGRVHLKFSIRDTGPGIAKAQQQEIFKMFVQGQAGSWHPEGVGLGLATATQLIQMMGGRIWVESDVGQGSTFYFTATLGVDAEARAPQKMSTALAGTRVLIVDDNPTTRGILIEMVETWGMAPAAVEDGEIGLARLRAAVTQGTPFRLVLIDSEMPKMGGLEVSQVIHDDPSLRGTQQILLSSTVDDSEEERALALGMVARLRKPVSCSLLLETIEAALGVNAAPPTEEESAGQAQTTRSLRVLLVEDNPVNQVVISRILEYLGHQVVTADNGQEALDAIAGDHFDVALMDYEMPVMNGMEAARRIREEEAKSGGHLPLVALSAYAMPGDREQLLATGMDSSLTKPVHIEEIQAALEEVTQGTSEQQRSAPPAEKEPGEAVLDVSTLRQAGTRDSLAALVAMLEEQLPQLRGEIAEAISESAPDRLRKSAHSLKGSVSMFGAKRSTEAARKLEMMGRNEMLEGAGELLAELDSALAELRPALAELREQLESDSVEVGASSQSSEGSAASAER